MDLSGFAAAARTPEQTTPEVLTAVVVRADESGLWVAPVDDDPRHPVGPCRGGWTANGTRVPPGALVALVMTPDGPWAIGVDNPALAISDGTLAPFQNPSFESETDPGVPASWGHFGLFGDVHTRIVLTGVGAAHGQRHIRVEKNGAGAAFLDTTRWTVVPGTSLELFFYARRVTGNPLVQALTFSTAPGQGDPSLVNPNSVLTPTSNNIPTDDWLRYRAVVTLPPTHVRVQFLLRVESADGNPCAVDFDNADADLIDVDPTAAHQDFIRRATATLTGGGTRTVTAGGNLSWSQPLTIAGAGLSAEEAVDGRFDITMPANGVVIPVHHSLARTSVTVTGGAILLNPNEALWYELPVGQAAASQPGRFHVLASELADGFTVPPHWILVVRRTAWSSTSHAPEYLWGDGQQQDPWRTPDLNSGWTADTLAPRYSKGPGQTVRLIGRVKDGVGSAFTLPPGYRPTTIPHDDVVRDGAGNPALITVTTGGVVTTAGSNTDHSIATTFVAGQ